MNAKDKLIHLAVISEALKAAELLVDLGLIEGPPSRYIRKYTSDRPHVQKMFDDENSFSDMEKEAGNVTVKEIARTVDKKRPSQKRW